MNERRKRRKKGDEVRFEKGREKERKEGWTDEKERREEEGRKKGKEERGGRKGREKGRNEEREGRKEEREGLTFRHFLDCFLKLFLFDLGLKWKVPFQDLKVLRHCRG